MIIFYAIVGNFHGLSENGKFRALVTDYSAKR